MTRAYFGTHPDPEQRWEQILSEPQSRYAVDTETVSLSNRTLIGTGLALSGEEAFYLTPDDSDWPRMVRILQDPRIGIDYHNAPFDLRVLRPHKVDIHNIQDTAVMARLANIPAVLEDAAEYAYFNWQLPTPRIQRAPNIMEEFGVKGMDKVPVERMAQKCIDDARATFMLADLLPDMINLESYEVERQVISILESTSQAGIKLDQERRGELSTYYRREFTWCKTVAQGMGFDPAKNFEVGYILSEAGAFLPFTEKKTMLATDNKTLRKITTSRAIPLAQLVLHFRHVAKMLNTYIDPLAGQDRAYTMMHVDAVTGRISPTSAGKNNPDRNLANIPKRVEKGTAPPIRGMFVGDDFPDGEVTKADESQVELRILAYLSQDPLMLATFADPLGDIHAVTELAIWGTNGPNRVAAKTFNFAMIYGADAQTVADNIETNDLAKVSMWMKKWMATYTGAARWIDDQIAFGLENGYVLTLFGRRLNLPADMGEKHMANCAINYPIQGSAAEIFKRMILACQGFQSDHRLYTHDEILSNGHIEMPSGLDEISPIRTPVEVEYGRRWSRN